METEYEEGIEAPMSMPRTNEEPIQAYLNEEADDWYVNLIEEPNT